jgi:hypothetical protein
LPFGIRRLRGAPRKLGAPFERLPTAIRQQRRRTPVDDRRPRRREGRSKPGRRSGPRALRAGRRRSSPDPFSQCVARSSQRTAPAAHLSRPRSRCPASLKHLLQDLSTPGATSTFATPSASLNERHPRTL